MDEQEKKLLDKRDLMCKRFFEVTEAAQRHADAHNGKVSSFHRKRMDRACSRYEAALNELDNYRYVNRASDEPVAPERQG